MPKDFSRTADGKVTDCTYNIAQMNPFQHLYFNMKYWGYWKQTFQSLQQYSALILLGLGCILILPLLLFNMVCPVFSLCAAYRDIKDARNHNKTYEELEKQTNLKEYEDVEAETQERNS